MNVSMDFYWTPEGQSFIKSIIVNAMDIPGERLSVKQDGDRVEWTVKLPDVGIYSFALYVSGPSSDDNHEIFVVGPGMALEFYLEGLSPSDMAISTATYIKASATIAGHRCHMMRVTKLKYATNGGVE